MTTRRSAIRQPGASKTVIVADDTAFVRDRFRDALGRAGHRVLTTGTGLELLSQMRSERDHFDLVVLDLHLPEDGGLEFERIDPGRQLMVDQFVERHFFKNRRA